MSNPHHHHHSLLGHGFHGKTLALTSSGDGPKYSATLPFDSAMSLSSQGQGFPESDQLVSHHRMGEARNRFSNPLFPFGLHVHRTSERGNNVDLNFIGRNNSSRNLNLLGKKPPSQLASNDPFAPSSSTPPVRSSVCNPEFSNFQQPHQEQTSHPSPIHSQFQSGILTPTENQVLVSDGGHGLLHESHPVKEEVSEPNFKHNYLPHHPHQEQASHTNPIDPCLINNIYQSGMGLGLFNQPFGYFPAEEPDHPPGFPTPILNPFPAEEPDHPPGFPTPILNPDGGDGILRKKPVHTGSHVPDYTRIFEKVELRGSKRAPKPNLPTEEHDHPPGFPRPSQTPGGGNGIIHENPIHTQSNLPSLESHLIKKEVGESAEAVKPSFNHNSLPQSPHQGQPSHPCPMIPSPNHTFFQSGRGLGFFNQQSRYFPTEEPSHPPGFPGPILTPDGGHGILHKNPIPHRPDFKIFFSKVELRGSKQAPKPNFNHKPHRQTENLRGLSQVPSQNDKENATMEPHPQARGCRRSPMRNKSQPYKKHGPYKCEKCGGHFVCAHRFSAHYQKHYKYETPAEKKRRHERKIKNRDLQIARCANGITILPGSSPLVAANVSDGRTKNSKRERSSSSLNIKEEN